MFGALAVPEVPFQIGEPPKNGDTIIIDQFIFSHLAAMAEYEPKLADLKNLNGELIPYLNACAALHQYFTPQLQGDVINDFESRKLLKNQGKVPQYVESIAEALHVIVNPHSYLQSLLTIYWDNSYESFHIIKDSFNLPPEIKVHDRTLKTKTALTNRLAEIHREVQGRRRMLSCDLQTLGVLTQHRSEYMNFMNAAQLAEIDKWIKKLTLRTDESRNNGIFTFRSNQGDFDSVAKFHRAIGVLGSNAYNLRELLQIRRNNPIEFHVESLTSVINSAIPISKRIHQLVGGYRPYDFLPYDCIKLTVYEVDFGSPYFLTVSVAGYMVGKRFIPLESYDQSKTRIIQGVMRAPFFEQDGNMLVDPALDLPVLLPHDNKLELLHMGNWYQPAAIKLSRTNIVVRS